MTPSGNRNRSRKRRSGSAASSARQDWRVRGMERGLRPSRHPSESRDAPGRQRGAARWIPAFAGMTMRRDDGVRAGKAASGEGIEGHQREGVLDALQLLQLLGDEVADVVGLLEI